MKQLYTLMLLLVTGFCLAQKPIEGSKQISPINFQHNQKADSLVVIYPGNWMNATDFLIYSTPGGGYVHGTNEYLDLSKAQRFMISEPQTIVGAYFWIGALDGFQGTIRFRLWDFNGEPDQVLATKEISMADLQAQVNFEELYFVQFDSPIDVTKDYAIGVEMFDMGISLFSLVGSADGQGGNMDLVWEQWNDGRWYSYLDPNGWNFDLDLGVFPVICVEKEEVIDDFEGGKGTMDDPFLIATAEQLNSIRQYPDRHYRMINDINLDPYLLNANNTWNPIGNRANAFTGYFDGDGYEISNLIVNGQGQDRQGLFGFAEGATIMNLVLDHTEVLGSRYVGAICGQSMNTTVQNITVSGNITGSVYTGGIIGLADGTSAIIESGFQGVVTGEDRTGGLVGHLSDQASITESYSLGTVVGETYTGGVLGESSGKSSRSKVTDNGIVISFPPGSDHNPDNLIANDYHGMDLTRDNETLVSPAIELGFENATPTGITEKYEDGQRVPFYSITFPLTETDIDPTTLRARVRMSADVRLPVFGEYDKASNSYTIQVLGLHEGWKMGVVSGDPVVSVSATYYPGTINKSDYDWKTFEFVIKDDSDKTMLTDTIKASDIESSILPIARDVLIRYFSAGFKKPKLNADSNNKYHLILINSDAPGNLSTYDFSYYQTPSATSDLASVFIHYPSYMGDVTKPSTWKLKFVIGHELFHAIQSGYGYLYSIVGTGNETSTSVTCYEEGTANVLGQTYADYGDINTGSVSIRQSTPVMGLNIEFDDHSYDPYTSQDFFAFIARRYFNSTLSHQDDLWKSLALVSNGSSNATDYLAEFRIGFHDFLYAAGYGLPWAFTEFALQRIIIHDEEYLLRDTERNQTNDKFKPFNIASDLLTVNNKSQYKLWQSKSFEEFEYDPVTFSNFKSMTAAAVKMDMPEKIDPENRPDTLHFQMSLTGSAMVENELDKEGVRIAIYRKGGGELVSEDPTLLIDDIDEPIAVPIGEEVDELAFVIVNAHLSHMSTSFNLRIRTEGEIHNITQNQKYPTIQEAVNAAHDGDIIEVPPGTYNEFVLIQNAGITLRSTGGAANTIIDGTGIQYPWGLNVAPTRQVYTTIDGFTFSNWEIGAGAYDNLASTNSTTEIKNCVFKRNDKIALVYQSMAGIISDNTLRENGNEDDDSKALIIYNGDNTNVQFNTITENTGGGIDVTGDAYIYNNIITYNTSDGAGGGIEVWGGSPRIEYNSISGNRATVGAGIKGWDAAPIIRNNTIDRNTAQYDGGGISVGNSGEEYYIIIENNTISYNESGQHGGGIDCFWCGGEINNNDIRNNRALRGGGIYFHQALGTWSGNTIGGNYATSLGGGVAGLNIPGRTRVIDDGQGKLVFNHSPCFDPNPGNNIGGNSHGETLSAPGPNGTTCTNAAYDIYCK